MQHFKDQVSNLNLDNALFLWPLEYEVSINIGLNMLQPCCAGQVAKGSGSWGFNCCSHILFRACTEVSKPFELANLTPAGLIQTLRQSMRRNR